MCKIISRVIKNNIKAMEKEKTKQIRSISVDSAIYNRFRTICNTEGLIMSVQFQRMMEKFIEGYTHSFDGEHQFDMNSKKNV